MPEPALSKLDTLITGALVVSAALYLTYLFWRYARTLRDIGDRIADTYF